MCYELLYPSCGLCSYAVVCYGRWVDGLWLWECKWSGLLFEWEKSMVDRFEEEVLNCHLKQGENDSWIWRDNSLEVIWLWKCITCWRIFLLETRMECLGKFGRPLSHQVWRHACGGLCLIEFRQKKIWDGGESRLRTEIIIVLFVNKWKSLHHIFSSLVVFPQKLWNRCYH